MTATNREQQYSTSEHTISVWHKDNVVYDIVNAIDDVIRKLALFFPLSQGETGRHVQTQLSKNK